MFFSAFDFEDLRYKEKSIKANIDEVLEKEFEDELEVYFIYWSIK